MQDDDLDDDDGVDAAEDDEATDDEELMMPALPSRPQFARKLAVWSGAHDFVQSILVMAGGLIVSGGDSGVVRMHRVGTHGNMDEPPVSLQGHAGAVMCLDAPSSDQASTPPSSLFSGSVDHRVCKWDLSAGATRTATLEGHARSVHCLTLGYDGPSGSASDVLFTGSRDHTIKIWDLRTSARPLCNTYPHAQAFVDCPPMTHP